MSTFTKAVADALGLPHDDDFRWFVETDMGRASIAVLTDDSVLISFDEPGKWTPGQRTIAHALSIEDDGRWLIKRLDPDGHQWSDINMIGHLVCRLNGVGWQPPVKNVQRGKFYVKRAPKPVDGGYDCAIKATINGEICIVAEVFHRIGDNTTQDAVRMAEKISVAMNSHDALVKALEAQDAANKAGAEWKHHIEAIFDEDTEAWDTEESRLDKAWRELDAQARELIDAALKLAKNL